MPIFHHPPWTHRGNLGNGGLAGGGVTFLLRDDFTTDDAAPIASPRTCEPGPGTWVFTDAAQWDITSGKLRSPTTTLSYCGSGASFARIAGRAAFWIDLGPIGANVITARAAWSTNQSTNYSSGNALFFSNNNGVIYPGGITIWSISTTAAREAVVVLRSTGAFYLDREGATDWRLFWVNNTTTGTPLYQVTLNSETAGRSMQTESIRVSDLAAPWNTDDGIATVILSGARSPGDTWTHEANHLTYTAITTLPTLLQIEFRLRIQDTLNYWQVTVDSAGKMDLDEVVAGVATERGTSTTVTAGERMGWIADGSTIAVYDSTARRINYATASNFATATSGELTTEGTGGAVTGIEVWPRTLSGTAKDALDAVVNA